MLVLSRKRDETILIGNEITVTVLEVRGNTVRLGLRAPREVAIRRGELSLAAPDAPAPTSAMGTAMFVIETALG